MCLNNFQNEVRLLEHQNYCGLNKEARITFPSGIDSIIEFKNYNRKMKVPFVIYADVESLIRQIKEKNIIQTIQLKFRNMKPSVLFILLNMPMAILKRIFLSI